MLKLNNLNHYNTVERLKTNTHKYCHLIYDKGATAVLDQFDTHFEKYELTPYLTLTHKSILEGLQN